MAVNIDDWENMPWWTELVETILMIIIFIILNGIEKWRIFARKKYLGKKE